MIMEFRRYDAMSYKRYLVQVQCTSESSVTISPPVPAVWQARHTASGPTSPSHRGRLMAANNSPCPGHRFYINTLSYLISPAWATPYIRNGGRFDIFSWVRWHQLAPRLTDRGWEFGQRGWQQTSNRNVIILDPKPAMPTSDIMP